MKKIFRNASLIVSVLFISSCSLVQKTGEMFGDDDLVKASTDMSPRQEYYLGRSASAQLLASKKVIIKDEVHNYLNQLGSWLAVHSARPNLYNGYHFAVLDDPTPSALSTPGGFIFISKGLINQAANEDEVAAVIAHEISHIVLQHANKSIRSKSTMKSITKVGSFLASIVTDGAVDGDDVDLFSDVVQGVSDISYGKSQETAADAGAIDILSKAGYDARALATVLKKIDSKASFLSKHPRSDARMKAIGDKVTGLKRVEVTDARTKRFVAFKGLLK